MDLSSEKHRTRLFGRMRTRDLGTQMMDGYSRFKVSSARRKSAVVIGMWFVRERKK